MNEAQSTSVGEITENGGINFSLFLLAEIEFLSLEKSVALNSERRAGLPARLSLSH